jgi:hypothetical protein
MFPVRTMDNAQNCDSHTLILCSIERIISLLFSLVMVLKYANYIKDKNAN